MDCYRLAKSSPEAENSIMDKLQHLKEKFKLIKIRIPKILVLDDFIEKLYSPQSRHLIHRTFIWGFFISSFYSLGKMTALLLTTEAKYILPSIPQHRSPPPSLASEINSITTRDLFHGPQGRKKVVKTKKQEGPCRSSNTLASLSGLALINTIVLQNEKKSVAAVHRGGGSHVLSLKQGDDIPSVGKVGYIEPLRMTFRSFKTQECEFLALKKEPEQIYSKLLILSENEGKKILKYNAQKKSIKQKGNHFHIKRDYIHEELKDLSSLLTKAKATPIKNSNGTLAFKITEINPGSLFTKLGIQDQDQIRFIDGRPIRSQTQIFSLFNSLKTIHNISITVLRNGNEQKLEYTLVD